MSDEWYFKSGETERGPFSFAALQELARRKELKLDDRVRAEIDGPWRFANSVPRLFVVRSHLAETSSTETQPAPPSKPNRVVRAEWFYRIGDREHGPISLDTLKEMAAVSGETASEILARKGKEGAWLPLEAAEKSEESATPPLSTAPQLTTAPDEKAVKSDTAVSRPKSLYRSTARQTSWKRDLLEKARNNAEILVGVAIWLAINAVVVAMTFRSYATERKYYESYQSIYKELQDLRSRKASEVEWSDFTQRSDETLDAIIKDLEKTSSVSEPIRQRLLWAGSRHLREMLSNAQYKSAPNQQSNQDERLFQEHMRWLDQALSGR